MKRLLRNLFVVVALCWVGVSAAQTEKALPIELGVMGGINVPSFSSDDAGADVQNKMGWQLGVVSSIKLRGVLNLEPQLIFQHQGFRLRSGDQSRHIKCNALQMPITASVGVARVLRLYAGPVVTLLDRAREKSGGDLLEFDRVYSTIGYTIGLRIKPQRHLLFDVRYNGQFTERENLKQHNETVAGDLNQFNVAISVGYLF